MISACLASPLVMHHRSKPATSTVPGRSAASATTVADQHRALVQLHRRRILIGRQVSTVIVRGIDTQIRSSCPLGCESAMSESLTLHELVPERGAKSPGMSPYVWRTRLDLA